MLKEERHQIILRKVLLHNRVLLGDLAEHLNVSVDTVRRDVKELDRGGKLRKVHGGAVSLGYKIFPYDEQEFYLHKKKKAIAKKAVKLIKNNQVLLIGGGTTSLELINEIPSKLRLTVFTPSLPVAWKLMSLPNIEVIFIGGKISRDSQVSVGGSALRFLSDIKADICFLGTGNIDAGFGISEMDWDVVQLKKAMIDASKKTVLLTISEKLNSTQSYKICDISQLDTLVTELSPDSAILKEYRNQKIDIL
ncbi:DeoR/GlpR family DNA-binding transcription regulator [Gramella jeungdoensis]|uniref:DeoR/GlpR family DNA-binding transcription regulator n=1 Tax=Gramella jeungdoensis TaxID=708091 RepID=A0ABT0Z1D5_9FLAO|nr:DeoR/GlpR family DNA-binding transcription regulator [Gramella jeungdoensis]MCM8569085.1 DeoR/GlpR family DNA-binding transcription regulator [Gramella jeungdoensis]